MAIVNFIMFEFISLVLGIVVSILVLIGGLACFYALVCGKVPMWLAPSIILTGLFSCGFGFVQIFGFIASFIRLITSTERIWRHG